MSRNRFRYLNDKACNRVESITVFQILLNSKPQLELETIHTQSERTVLTMKHYKQQKKPVEEFHLSLVYFFLHGTLGDEPINVTWFFLSEPVNTKNGLHVVCGVPRSIK